MRTTVILDDDLVAEAGRLTGIDEKTRLLHMGLEALIHRESAKRLAKLGGSKPDFSVAHRRNVDEMLKVAEAPVKYGSRRHKHLD